jgi:hypothetical protein
LGDAVWGTSEAGEQRFVEEPPPRRAEGEKGLPLRAELDAKSSFHVGGGSPTSGSDVHGGVVFLAAAWGLAHLRAWLATNGHGDGDFLSVAERLKNLRAWLVADGL